MPQITDRLALPLLVAGQSQKEISHNEALALVDMLVQPVVQSIGPTSNPASPTAGQCWIVGNGATGAWAGHDGAIAAWTSGGWRFVPPQNGMIAWSIADGVFATRNGGAWLVGVSNVKALNVNNVQVIGPQQPAIAAPIGGTTIDTQSRATIANILQALRAHGLISN